MPKIKKAPIKARARREFLICLERGDRGSPEKFPHIRAHRLRVLERPAVRRTLALEGLNEIF